MAWDNLRAEVIQYAMTLSLTDAAIQEAFDHIWSQEPDRQNRHASTWWFFLLFPEGEEGFGPRQLMFTVATRAGRSMRISDVTMAGLDRKRPLEGDLDCFPALNVGWYCDGELVHDDYVKHQALAEMSFSRGDLRCLSPGADGQPRGIAIRRSAAEPLVMECDVYGPGREAHFRTWSDMSSPTDSPHVALDIDTPFGGTHYIAVRRLQFEGEFDLPTGRERLTGTGFFQRVGLNIPLFPWKWIWAAFPDGTLFSAYVPYIGLNLFRKGYRFFKSNRVEQASLSIAQSATWIPPRGMPATHFKRASVTPVLGRGPHPQFDVTCSGASGDALRFTAAPYGHTRFYIDRPSLGGLAESHWSYNEYMFRMEGLNGTVGGRPISRDTVGQAFGSLEYTYGLGL